MHILISKGRCHQWLKTNQQTVQKTLQIIAQRILQRILQTIVQRILQKTVEIAETAIHQIIINPNMKMRGNSPLSYLYTYFKHLETSF